jgi:hypothetical protein
MTTAYTSLLGLALPVTGELSGTWGDTVNNSITSLLDTSVAGTTNVSTDGDVTLTTTTGAANTARQAILLFSGARTALRTVTAPAQSKVYTVINATTGGFSVKLVGSGPTTGVTVVAGESAVCAWNGSDFIKISNTGGSASFVNLTASGTVTFTGLSASQAVFTNASDELVSNAITGTGNVVMSASPTLTGTIGAASLTLSTDLTLSGGTANGVAYLNGSKVVTSGSALTFDGTDLTLGTTGALLKLARLNDGALTGSLGSRTSGNFSFYNSGGSSTEITVASSDIRFDIGASEQMRLTSTGLGIGTSSPAEKLDVYVNSTSNISIKVGNTSGALQLLQGNGAAYLYTASNQPLIFSNNNTERMRLDSSGNLGLGVTPSAWGGGYKGFQINSTGALTSNGSNATGVGHNYYFDGTNNRYLTTGAANLFLMINNEHRFYTAPSGTAGDAITFTQAMTLDASGRLGIGTTSPSRQLDVQVASDGIAASFGKSGGTMQPRLVVKASESASTITIGADYAGATSPALTFETASTERARINSSGEFLIGTTTNAGSRPLQVYTSGNLANLYLNAARDTGGSEEVARIEFTASAPNSSASWFIYANDTSAQRFSVRSNGGIANFSANDVNLSDRREKTNFAPAGSYLDKICSIPVQTFNYIDQNLEEDAGLTLGVVAQDVQAVAPELVMESDWSSEKDGSKTRLSIYQTDLQYALMKCIQEQQAIIESLKARLDAANL